MIGTLPDFAGCEKCTEYADRRGPKVLPLIVHKAAQLRMRPARLATRYFEGIHERHLSGRSL